MCGRARQNFAGKAPLASKLILELSDRFVETWGGVGAVQRHPAQGAGQVSRSGQQSGGLDGGDPA